MKKTRLRGITYVEIRCRGCLALKQMLMSESLEDLRLCCTECNLHWDISKAIAADMEYPRLTRDEVLAALLAICEDTHGDSEGQHIEADALLLNLVDDEVAAAYDKIGKWYA